MSAPPYSGLVTVRLVNRGRQMHHVVVSPVVDSLTLRHFYELAIANQPTALVRDIGGPNLTAPGDSSEVTLFLAAGRYVLTCWVNAADGKPHIMHGMMSELRVGRGAKALPPPSATVVIRASDYAFDISGRWRAGDNTIAFENNGPQEHDVQLVRLSSHQSIDTIRRWAESGGVGGPSAAIVGGSTGIDKGRRVWFTLNLPPGRYAMFCFVPDARDGKMHLLHGMLREIVIS